MPYGWIDGLQWKPGRNADYRSGRIVAQGGVAHETVGVNSEPIGLAGVFQFLGPKEDVAIQFAQWDAWCPHACEWNITCVGYELERFPGEPMTPTQMYWIRYTLAAIEDQSGGAVRLAWKGHAPVWSPWDMGSEWANHGALQIRACDPHTDGWSEDEWAVILGGAPAATTGGNSVYHMLWPGPAPGNPRTFRVDGLQIIEEIPYGDPRGYLAIHQEALDAEQRFGIPIVDGRLVPPFGTRPLGDVVFDYTAGRLFGGGSGGGGAPVPMVLDGTFTGVAVPQ